MSEQPTKNQMPIDVEEPMINEEPVIVEPLMDDDQENPEHPENEIPKAIKALTKEEVLALGKDTEIIEIDTEQTLDDDEEEEGGEADDGKEGSDEQSDEEGDEEIDEEEEEDGIEGVKAEGEKEQSEEEESGEEDDDSDDDSDSSEDVPNGKVLKQHLTLINNTLVETGPYTENDKSTNMEWQLEMDLNHIVLVNIVNWIKKRLSGEDPSDTPLKSLLDRTKETMIMFQEIKDGGRRPEKIKRIEALFKQISEL